MYAFKCALMWKCHDTPRCLRAHCFHILYQLVLRAVYMAGKNMDEQHGTIFPHHL